MSDISRLQEKLAKLNAASQDGERSIGGGGGGDDAGGLLRALLAEIDETVLARELTFQNETGDVLAIDVANRRVLRVSRLSGDGRLQRNAGIIGQPITREVETAGLAFYLLLEDFLDASSVLKVMSGKVSQQGDAAEIGCSVAALEEAWVLGEASEADDAGEVDAGEVDDTGDARIEGFREYCQSIASAWLANDSGGDQQSSGKSADVARLETLADTDLSLFTQELSSSFNSVDMVRCVVVGAEAEIGQSALLVAGGSEQSFYLIPTDKIPDVIGRWHGGR